MAAVERLYRRRVPQDKVLSLELAKAMCQLSLELRRPLAVLLTRRGQVKRLSSAPISHSATTLSKFRAGSRSLRGLRLIRTQLHDQPLSQESLTDLAYLRLDLFGVVSVTPTGNPGMLYVAHLLPPNGTGQLCNILKGTPFQQQTLVFDRFIEELETDMHALTALTPLGMMRSRPCW